jgi:GH24 family phage-related lysozyme (muramidase)
MSQFNQFQQSIFEEGPRTSPQVAMQPFQYKEAEVILPNPININLAVNDKTAWYSLGQEAFKVAGKLYEDVLDYQIKSMGNEIEDSILTAEDKVTDINNQANLRIMAGEDPRKVMVDVVKQFDDSKKYLSTRLKEVLGEDRYNFYTSENPDLSTIGTSYQELALLTKKGYVNLENSYQNNLLNLNQAIIGQDRSKKAVKSFLNNDYDSENYEGLPGLFPIFSGQLPVPVKENTNTPVYGWDSNEHNPLKDGQGNPVLVSREGKWYFNTEANIPSVLTDTELRNISIQDSLSVPIVNKYGTKIHPDFVKALEAVLKNQKSVGESYIILQGLASITPTTLGSIVRENGITKNDANKLMILRLAIISNATREKISEILKKTNEDDLARFTDFVNNLRLFENGELSAGTNTNLKDFPIISNAVIDYLMQATGKQEELSTYRLDTGNVRPGFLANDTGDEFSVVDLLQDRNFTTILARVYSAIESNPSIIKKLGETREKQINTFLSDFLPQEFSQASLTFMGRSFVISPSVSNFSRQVGHIKSDPKLYNEEILPPGYENNFTAMVAAASLGGSYSSGITPGEGSFKTLPWDQSVRMMVSFIQTVNPQANLDIAETLVRNFDDFTRNQRGEYISKGLLSDATLLRIAYSSDPYIIQKVLRQKVEGMDREQLLSLSVQTMQRISSAEYWEWRLDYTDTEAMETYGGGIPMGIRSIRYKQPDGSYGSIQPTSTSNLAASDGAFYPKNNSNNFPVILTNPNVSKSDFKKFIENWNEGNTEQMPSANYNRRSIQEPNPSLVPFLLSDMDFYLGTLGQKIKNYAAYYESRALSENISNPEVTSPTKLKSLLLQNLAHIQAILQIDPEFEGIETPHLLYDLESSPPQPPQLIFSTAIQKQPVLLFKDNRLFTDVVIEQIWKKGQKLGLEKFSDYLALSSVLEQSYSSNPLLNIGYNFRKAINDPEFDPENPFGLMRLTSGPNQGLVLWEDRPNQLAVLQQLVREGYIPYIDQDTNELYAFTDQELDYDRERFERGDRYWGTNRRVLFGPLLTDQLPESLSTEEGEIGLDMSKFDTYLSNLDKRITTTYDNDYFFGFKTDAQIIQDTLYPSKPTENNIEKYMKPPPTFMDEVKRDFSRQWENFKDKFSSLPKELFSKIKDSLFEDAPNAITKMNNWQAITPVNDLALQRQRSAQYAGWLVRSVLYDFGLVDSLQEDPNEQLSGVNVSQMPKLTPSNKLFPNNNNLSPKDIETINEFTKEAIPYITEYLNKNMPSPGAVSDTNKPDVEEATIKITPLLFPLVFNKDGSVSNVKTMSFSEEKNGPEILIPTIKNGKVMTAEEAIAEYKRTKQHFGIFSTPEKANAFAKKLHDEEEKKGVDFEKTWLPLISTYEGFSKTAYNKDGVWTIGKGSTTHPDGTPVKAGDTITKKNADLYLRHYVYTKVIPTLSRKIPTWYDMNSNQQSSLISFAYNVGENFYGLENFTTITRALRTKENWKDVPSALMLYVKGYDNKQKKKVVLPGLVKRRQEEANLWSKEVTK